MLLCWIVCSLAGSSRQAFTNFHPNANLYADPDPNRYSNRNSHVHPDSICNLTTWHSQPDTNPTRDAHAIRYPQPIGNLDRDLAASGNCIEHPHIHSDSGAQPYIYTNSDPSQRYQLTDSNRNPLANRDPDTDRDSQRYSTSAAYHYAVKAVQ